MSTVTQKGKIYYLPLYSILRDLWLLWELSNHSNVFSIFPGDSAGGNLAAALSLWLRDGGNAPQFAYQVLLYPWLQSYDLNLPSHYQNDRYAYDIVNNRGIATAALTYLNQSLSYIGDLLANSHTTPEIREKYGKYVDWNKIPKEYIPKGYTRPRNAGNAKLATLLQEELTNPYLFPGMADDVSDLPPAFVLTIDNDCLRDDGIIYALRLEAAGNEVVHDNDKEGWHGMFCFMSIPFNFDAAHKATDMLADFIKDTTKIVP